MAMLDEACEISARYDPSVGGVAITIMGNGMDVFTLLTIIANQIAEKSETSTEHLLSACNIAAPLMRSAEGAKFEVSPDLIKKSKGTARWVRL